MTPNDNIFGFERQRILQKFAAHIEGSSQALFVAVVDSSCSARLREALEKAAAARGYVDGVTWLDPWAHEADLGEAEMLEVLEGLDPLCVVAVGPNATALLSAVYRLPDGCEERVLAWGRPMCLIAQAEKLIENEAGRQHLWALIKSLPQGSQGNQ